MLGDGPICMRQTPLLMSAAKPGRQVGLLEKRRMNATILV